VAGAVGRPEGVGPRAHGLRGRRGRGRRGSRRQGGRRRARGGGCRSRSGRAPIVSSGERGTGIWLVAGLAMVLAIDSLFPLGVASGMLYVPLLFLCQPANGPRGLLRGAAARTVLIVLDLSSRSVERPARRGSI